MKKMDPWYFLDLETNIKDQDDNELELNEIGDMMPNGDWILNCEEYDGDIIFKGKNYKYIEFNNETKTIRCVNASIIKLYILNIS